MGGHGYSSLLVCLSVFLIVCLLSIAFTFAGVE